jgi:MYXO-CTERM domain-containing protein
MHHALRNALVVCFVAAAGLLVGIGQASAYTYLYQCGPTWPAGDQPLPYSINTSSTSQGTSTSMTGPEAVQIIQDSFAAWGQPSCSDFRGSYQGLTTERAESTNQKAVFSWIESSWPSQLGDVNSTIGVTLTRVRSDCVIVRAPIVFNGVGHFFTDQCSQPRCNFGEVDLQSIATHEIGHLLGLNHSSVPGATMFASYSGGTGTASLSQDDIDAVCSLYPFTGPVGCMGPSDCGDKEDCVNGECVEVGCQDDDDCDDGLECNPAGDCVVPPCMRDMDCGEGFECDTTTGSCVQKCPVCRTCSDSSQCGGGGVCVDFGNGPSCIVGCDDGGLCPGDSECKGIPVSGGRYWACIDPFATTVGEICGTNWICGEESVTDPCEMCGPDQVCVDDMCVDEQMDMGGSTQTDMGTGTSDMGADPMPDTGASPSSDMGSTSAEPDMGGGIVLIDDDDEADSGGVESVGCGCRSTSAPARPDTPLGVVLAALLGLAALARRRR